MSNKQERKPAYVDVHICITLEFISLHRLIPRWRDRMGKQTSHSPVANAPLSMVSLYTDTWAVDRESVHPPLYIWLDYLLSMYGRLIYLMILVGTISSKLGLPSHHRWECKEQMTTNTTFEISFHEPEVRRTFQTKQYTTLDYYNGLCFGNE